MPNWTELITEAMQTDELLAEFNTAVANATTNAFDRDRNVEYVANRLLQSDALTDHLRPMVKGAVQKEMDKVQT